MPENRKKAIVVGLVGGIASGKSYVAKQLEKMGAMVVNADQLAHDVLQKPLIVRTLLQRFGQRISNDQGGVDRAKLAAIVFGADPETTRLRKQLETLVHPMVHAEVIHCLRALNERDTGAPPMVVIDAPLLLEAGWQPMCDAIIFVDVPDAIRQRRAIERGWTLSDLSAREESQMPLSEKREQATHVVNNHDHETLLSQLTGIWKQLVN
jgi:dephospho-CoA kinase